MAVNESRSMNAEFGQGSVDRTYIQLAPDRGVVENPPMDRLEWPTYRNVGKGADNPLWEAQWIQAQKPIEFKTRSTGDPRF